MRRKENHQTILQSELFHFVRLTRRDASITQECYNRTLEAKTDNYRDRKNVYQTLESLDNMIDHGETIRREVEATTTPLTLEDLQEELEIETENLDEYQVMDYLEDNTSLQEELDGVYIDPLNMILEDSRKLELSIKSSPKYQEIKREIQKHETEEERIELQEDVYLQAEKIGFHSSKLETLMDRLNNSNIEAAKPILEEQSSRTMNAYMKGIGLIKDVNNYRMEHGLQEQNKYVNTCEPTPTITEPGENLAEDIEASILHQSMSEAYEELIKTGRLLDHNFFEKISDSEIITR